MTTRDAIHIMAVGIATADETPGNEIRAMLLLAEALARGKGPTFAASTLMSAATAAGHAIGIDKQTMMDTVSQGFDSCVQAEIARVGS